MGLDRDLFIRYLSRALDVFYVDFSFYFLRKWSRLRCSFVWENLILSIFFFFLVLEEVFNL